MAKNITGNDLKKIGFKEGPLLGQVLSLMEKHYPNESKGFKKRLAQQLYSFPLNYLKHEVWDGVAQQIIDPTPARPSGEKGYELEKELKPYRIYGAENIEAGARDQMDIAMRLPVTVEGALMPDAHHGYGLPIGGVLATENAVIPYGVGVDIGCRMCMTVYDLPPSFIDQKTRQLKQMLKENTKFGQKETFDNPYDDAVLEREEFREIKVVGNLKDRAYRQIGTSGSGNHFVEFGIVDILDPENELDVPVGSYLGVLSHSGSRGLGANIARHYTKLAREMTKLPKEAQHLAWLDLDSEEGQEYWQAMTLAGDYASACHHHIHRRLGQALGEQPLTLVENHHNFAWKEKLANGKEVIVHRKGATPAGKGVLGIIPGSMTAPGFIVRGKGMVDSLQSASHGAGRVMSRTKAKQMLSQKEVTQYLARHGIELIGGGLDEAPMVYKDINEVMGHQKDLVDVLGKFTPRVVRMDK